MGQLSTAKVSDSPFIIKGKGASMWEKENIQLWGADTCWLGKIKGAVVKMSVIWLKVGQLCYSPIQARWIHTYHQVEADTGMGKDFIAKVGASTSHKGIYILIMGRLRMAVGENVCYLTKCGGGNYVTDIRKKVYLRCSLFRAKFKTSGYSKARGQHSTTIHTEGQLTTVYF